MKKRLMFVLMLSSAIGVNTMSAQFIREYNIRTGENQDWPVDVNYYKPNDMYLSLHYSNKGNMPVLEYDGTTYANRCGYNLTDGKSYDPQAMVQSGSKLTTVLFNDNSSSAAIPSYNVLQFDHTSGAINWQWNYPSPSTDFTIKGRDITVDEADRWLYVVADMTTRDGSQSFLYIAKLSLTTGVPIWWNMYVAPSYNLASNNIFYYSKDEIYVGAGASNQNDQLDRGAYVMEINSAGNIINQTLLRYTDDCIRSQMTPACVKRFKSELYVVGSSYMEDQSRRGDYFVAQLNALAGGFPINVATVYNPKSFYMFNNVAPKFEFVNGNRNIMVSGINTPLLASDPGYVHNTYQMATTAYSGGFVYPNTNVNPDGSPIPDAYNPGSDQVFSVAEDFGRAPLYYGFRSKSDGNISDECQEPYDQPEECRLINSDIDVAPRPLNPTRVTLRLVSKPICQDYQLICGFDQADRSMLTSNTDEKTGWNVYPNPASTSVEIGYGSNIQTITINNIKGEQIRTFNNVNSLHLAIDINELPKGMYFIHATGTDGTVLNRKFVKE